MTPATAAPGAPVAASTPLSSVEIQLRIQDAERDHRLALAEQTQHATGEAAALLQTDTHLETHDDGAEAGRRKVRQASARIAQLRTDHAAAVAREAREERDRRRAAALALHEEVARLRADRSEHGRAVHAIDQRVAEAEFDIAGHEAFVASHDAAAAGR